MPPPAALLAELLSNIPKIGSVMHLLAQVVAVLSSDGLQGLDAAQLPLARWQKRRHLAIAQPSVQYPLLVALPLRQPYEHMYRPMVVGVPPRAPAYPAYVTRQEAPSGSFAHPQQ